MLIHGQVELSCAFGRIGCLDAEIFASEPYRVITIPKGTRWYEGAEYMRLRGISKEKAGIGHRRKPDWVIELPPDWEAIAIWEGKDGWREGQLWADYGEHRDLSGLFLDIREDGYPDEQYDWWDDWFKLPGNPEREAGIEPNDGTYLLEIGDWFEIRTAIMVAAHSLKCNEIPEFDCDGRIVRNIMLTTKLRQMIQEWLEKTLTYWHSTPWGTDVEIYDWSDICGWCLTGMQNSEGAATLDGLHICERCGQEYLEEQEEMFREAEEVAAERGVKLQLTGM